ncbi:MAG: hypothetical protein JWN41_1300 [Thermoleophilia bacterium]|nr:hypothetical protein [Thermoleophilia bacterium]
MARRRKPQATDSHADRRRARLAERQGGRCHYCGTAMTPQPRDPNERRASDITIEHLVPRVLGGGNAPGNLVAACRGCNTIGARIDKWCVDIFGGRRMSRAEQHRMRQSGAA